MEPLNPKRVHNPEAQIQKKIIEFLVDRGWTVMPTHGNAAQRGFPDLYCVHPHYGQRWIEVKYDAYFSFTKAQLEFFPKINKAGIGIWIMTQPLRSQYQKLFDRQYFPQGNWVVYYRQKALLGGAANRLNIDPKDVKCGCGQVWPLRPHESMECYCGRKVRL